MWRISYVQNILRRPNSASKEKRALFTQPVSILILTLLLLPLIIFTGCGEVHLNLETLVKPSGAVIQHVNIEASDKLADALAESGAVDAFKSDGWQTSTELKINSFTINAIKKFGKITSLYIPGISGKIEKTAMENVDLQVRNFIVYREYFLDVTLPWDSETGNVFTEQEGIGKSMLRSMFDMSWTISLPGTIIETNADSVENNKATWHFDIDSLENDRHMTIHTMYIAWPFIIAIAIGIVLMIIFIVILTRPKGHPHSN